MGIDAIIVFGLLIVITILFVTEYVTYDIAALIIMGTLLLSGILTVEEGLSGLSNEATVTIAALFVVSEGIRRTGVLGEISSFFARLGKENYWLALLSMMGIIGVISAFINNTAAVAIFIPVVLGVAADMKESPSKLLMPLSFASMLGGVCTLIGTSTNILVSSIAEKHGEPAFSMFEFLPLGAVFFVLGFIYLFTIGIKLIPVRREKQELTSTFEMNQYLTDIVLEPGFEHYGSTIEEADLFQNLDLDCLSVFRTSGKEAPEGAKTVLQPGDVLRICGSVREIRRLLDREDVSILPHKEWHDVDFESGADTLVEAVIAPDSALDGKKIADVGFYERFGAVLLAVRHAGKLEQEDLRERSLTSGDSILLSMREDRVAELKNNRAFVVVSEIGLPSYRSEKMPVALAVLAGVVVSAALNLIPIVIGAVVGGIVMILTGCITNEEAYEAINWEVIFLLAGVLPLGIAMDKTGAATILSDAILFLFGQFGPAAILSGFLLLTMILTNVISNQATAALLAPIVIQTAATIGVSARPFLMAVTYGASLSFITPVGYQTNTLIWGPGQYHFTDFTKVGTPLNILFWIVGTLLIPVVWSF